MFGLFNIPCMSIVYSFATEATYPASEAMFASLLQIGSCLFSCMATYGSLYLMNAISTNCVLVLFIVVYGIALAVTFLLTEDLRRLNIAQQALQNTESTESRTD